MKFSTAALALTTMAGSASALSSVTFEPPLTFTQYEDACGGSKLYEGAVVAIEKLDVGTFCVVDNIFGEDGSVTTAYSKLAITGCTSDKIFEDWSKCEDSACSSCEAEYKAFTTWDSINPNAGADHCYVYNFSMDPVTEKTTRSTFMNTLPIYFHFDADVNESDIAEYLNIMDQNSCIAEGRPAAQPELAAEEPAMEEPTMEEPTMDEPTMDEPVSGASALGATLAFGVAAVTAMLL